MRTLSIILYILAGFAAVLAVGGNLYLQSLACAFGSPSGDCQYRWPWQMGGEDQIILVLVPLSLVAVLVALGWMAGRRR